MYKRMLKCSLIAVIIGVLSALGLFLVYGQSLQVSTRRLTIAKQPDCPLLVLSTGIDSTNPLEPHYSYSVTNRVEKPIIAYAIRETVKLGSGTPIVGTSFVHLPSETLILRPHESRQEDGGFGKASDRAPSEINISVDFVEFADGTRWGEDVGKSGDRLDGQRAGGEAAIKRYREALSTQGLQGLEIALDNPNLVQPQRGTTDSTDWREGFVQGVSVVKQRLIRAKVKDGQAGVAVELTKPFDSKVGRRDP